MFTSISMFVRDIDNPVLWQKKNLIANSVCILFRLYNTKESMIVYVNGIYANNEFVSGNIFKDNVKNSLKTFKAQIRRKF